MDRLPFQKPSRLVSDEALREYRREHPSCEVIGCRDRPCPEPHHLRSRATGRDDSAHNLIRLCPKMHLQWHTLGGHQWFERYKDRLTDETRRKVAAALRIEDAA